MAWNDRADVDLAQMIRDKVADKKAYIERFKKPWFSIKQHGEKYLGLDLSFVLSGRKKKEHFPLIKKEKRAYKKRIKWPDIPKDLGAIGEKIGGGVASLPVNTPALRELTMTKSNIEIVADWYLKKLNEAEKIN